MSTSTGIFNTSQFTQDLAKKSFSSMITRLMPNGSAPLFGISSMLGTENAVQWEHGFFTKTMVFPALEITASIDNSQTTLTVDSTENLLPGQLHQFFETKEIVLINQVLSATQISVVRGIGGGAAAITIGGTVVPNAYQVGNAYEEASLRPNALAINPVRITNLTQIFRNTWAISGSAEQVQVIAGKSTDAENKQDCAMFHATAIESALLFGKKSQGTRNGQPFRTMDGLINIVGNIAYYPPTYSVPNVYTALSTGTDANMLEDMLDPCFDQTTDPKIGNRRILFVGGKALRVINQIAMLNGEYKLVDGQTNWGLRFKTLTFARGTFDLVEHPLFNTNPYWAKMAVALDVSSFKIAYLGNRKTQEKSFNSQGQVAQDNGIDAIGGTLTTECTCEVKNPPANAIIYNLTAALKNGETP